jgi:hypothetical protein
LAEQASHKVDHRAGTEHTGGGNQNIHPGIIGFRDATLPVGAVPVNNQ